MKVTVSIPDDIAQAADARASMLGLTRSAWYAKALRQQLRMLSDTELTTQINDLLKAQDLKLEPPVKAANNKTMQRNQW